MKIIFLGSNRHEGIVNKMLTEDFISNVDTANISLRALGLKIKSVSVINGETVAYVEDNNNLLLG